MNDTTSNGVVDNDILNVDHDDLTIPTFLQRGPASLVNAQHPRTHTAALAAVPVFEQQLPEAAAPLSPEGTTIVHPEQAPELVHEHAVQGHNEPPPSREELIKELNKDIMRLGKESGLGSAALPRLGLRVIRAAADGLISTEKPKAGEKSDAVRIYEAYAANDSKHAEHTSGGMKANAAKLNALIGLGTMTTCDGVVVADRTVSIRDRMEKAELKPKPLFAGLVDVARAQLASDQELTDAAIETALTKTKADKSIEKEWEAIQKKVDGLVTGEASHGLKDQSEQALKIAELIAEHVRQYKAGSDDAAMVEALMEKGHARSAAENVVRPGAEAGWSM